MSKFGTLYSIQTRERNISFHALSNFNCAHPLECRIFYFPLPPPVLCTIPFQVSWVISSCPTTLDGFFSSLLQLLLLQVDDYSLFLNQLVAKSRIAVFPCTIKLMINQTIQGYQFQSAINAGMWLYLQTEGNNKCEPS